MASKFLKFLFILYFTIFSVAPSFASSISPLTLPTGGQVASGNININESGPGKLVVNQTTNQGIINWQSFNVGVDAAVHFNTPNVTAGTLNNISGGTSTILGSIFSNGRLFFANPSGIIFKPGSQVKAEGLVASAMRISNQDFLANNFSLTNNQIANLQNEGNLEAQYVALIAPQVLNKGTITSNVATMIAAGDDVKLSISDSNRLSVNINPAKIKTLSSNEGVIKSENGTVSIQANAAQELIDQTINVPRSADSLISENGVIKLVSSSGLIKAKNVNLSAGPLGGTEVSGTIDASSNTKGGDIEITGKEIQVKSNSTLLATGETRGGNILVGGDWQGSNGVLQATYTTVEKDTLIDASSKGIGDGGKIVVWSDINNPNSKTVARGKLYAKANVGDGGKIETSGYALDIENVDSNTSSVQGLYGDYLIDPYNYEIDSAAWNNINSSLNNNNVTISTSSSNTDYGRSNSNDLSGRIDFHSGNRTYTHNRDATLTLNAANKVEIYANISTTSHKLNIVTNTDKVHGSGNLNLGGGTFTVDVSDASATEEYTGTLSNLSLVKDGAGRFNLAGTNTYTGTTTVSAGTLSVTGTLGSGTYAGNIANSATLAMGSSSNQTLSGIISGTGALTKSGSGTLTLSGNNTYSGATIISAGTLSASSLADTTAVSVVSGATYRLDQNDTVASIAGAGNIDLQNRTLTSAGASDTNFSGIISGTGALTLTGSNNLTLSGVNTYSGTTHINGGGLVLANSNALASNSITSTSGRFKTTERISDLTVAGDVTLIGDIATTGAQTYNNNVTLGAGSVVNPLTISSQNSDITFSGTVKTGSGAKAAQRSLTVNAGVGNVNFNDRVGYAFNGVGFNAGLTADSPYALSVTGGNITLKGDVMTFETQTYNGAVKIGGNGSNGTTRTLLSMDPKITFNGTVDDIQVNTHTLVAKAVQIRDNVLASGAPEVNFNRQVSSITSLAGYQGLTGYQIVSNEFGSIDPSASFGSVKLPPSSSSSSSNNSQAEQRNIEKKISSLKTNVANSSSNTKTGMTLSQLFSSFNPQAGTSFVKSIEIVYPNSPSFGVEKIKQNLPADAKSENNFNQNKSDQTKPNNQQNQKQNSSDGINDDERL